MTMQCGTFYKIGVILDIGIKNTHLHKFKTENGKLHQFQKVISHYINNLAEYKHMQVIDVYSYATNNGDILINLDTEIGNTQSLIGTSWSYINDINYNIHNQVKKNSSYTCIRFMPLEIIVQVNAGHCVYTDENVYTDEQIENLVFSKSKEIVGSINSIPSKLLMYSSNIKKLSSRNTGYICE